MHDQWDENLFGEMMTLEANCIKLSKGAASNSAFLCNVIDQGKYKWKFKLKKLANRAHWTTTIGIWKCNKHIEPKVNDIFTKGNHMAYGYAVNRGTLVDEETGSKADYGTKYGTNCKEGDIVEMLIDLDKLELKYIVNGKDYGKAFEIEKTAYKAAVNLFARDDEIEIIQ